MQIKNQITAIFLVFILGIVVIHNAIPHSHSDHSAVIESLGHNLNHSHNGEHHHAHKANDNTSIKLRNDHVSSDLGHHEHTVHLHANEVYLQTNTIHIEGKRIVSSAILQTTITKQPITVLVSYFSSEKTFTESPPIFNLSLRGPPALG